MKSPSKYCRPPSEQVQRACRQAADGFDVLCNRTPGERLDVVAAVLLHIVFTELYELHARVDQLQRELNARDDAR